MPVWWSAPTSHDAFVLSLVSLFITIIAAIVGFVGYVQLDDSLILIYGLENVVDFFSSAIVLWRFNTPSTTSTPTSTSTQTSAPYNDTEALSKREKRASIGVSIILAILGFGGFVTSVEDLLNGQTIVQEDDLNILLILSFSSFFIFAILAKFKFHYATQLHSPSLRKDGLCSFIGAILAFAMFFNGVLVLSTQKEDNIWWWLDPTVALVCALVALVYGLYGMYKAYVIDGYPIFSCQWWLYSGNASGTRGARGRLERRVVQNHSEEVRRQQSNSGDGDLELQLQRTDTSSMAGNPSVSGNGSLSMMPSKSKDEDMSDIVIT